jgi:hypothetical protein
MTASLTVLSGPRAGTRVDIEGSTDEILVGSDPDCRLALDLPGVSPIHARLWLDQAGLTVYDTHSPRGLYVNDARVESQAPVRDGDVLWLGTPGDEASVMIQCRVEGVGAPVSVIPDESPLAGLEPPVVAAPPPDDIVLADAPPSASDPMADLRELLAPPEAAPPAASAPPVETVAPVEEKRDDVFFMDEPAAPVVEAPPPVLAEPPPPPAPEPEPVVFFEESPAAPPQDDLFFVEEATPAPASSAAPAPAPTPPAVKATGPTAAAPRTAPPRAAAPKPVTAPAPPAAPAARPASKASAAPAPVAPRPVRRHGPTPPPSAAPESDDEGQAPPPRSAPARAAPPRAPRRSSPPLGLIAGGVGLVLIAAVAGVVALRATRTPAIESITPPRVGLGHSVTITGARFAGTPEGNVVQFGGKPGRVVQASATRLQVEIPELAAVPGRDTPVPVVVVVDGRESKAVSLGVFDSPRIHGISPNVAMPGDEVVLAGAGWGAGAKVHFGAVAAEVVDSSPTTLKVRVPALEGGSGTEFQVKVAMGGDASNAAPFLLGRLPLLISITPASAGPRDLVTLAGRGFDARPVANDVRVGGARALVAAATSGELKVVVPRTAAGEASVEVRVPGVDSVGQSKISVTPGTDPIDFRFIAELFEDTAGHDHAQLATGLGPAFVLSASGGRRAAERAVEAARRLNEAAGPLKASVDADIRARGLDGSPALVLAGRDVPLLEVTLDDAAAYEEDWTGGKGRGGAVTAARLAVWWEAVARDLVLLLIRGEKPHFAADLAPEGRVFADLHPLARKSVTAGVPRQVVTEARPALREALRVAALKVPAAVKGPAGTGPAGVAAAAPAFKLDGRWGGSERESGLQTYISASFAGTGGTLTFERALSVTVPVVGVEQLKGVVRFSVHTGAGPRYYQGRWDGQKMTGTISVDPGGRTSIGTFELSPG